MTPAELAQIHRRAMTHVPGPWDVNTLAAFIAAPGAILTCKGQGFALGRVIVDSAELLTLAVDPAEQRSGLGRACLSAFEASATEAGAVHIFLEVAVTNDAARTLYSSAGYSEDGIRRGYYRMRDGAPVDAINMSKQLTLRSVD